MTPLATISLHLILRRMASNRETVDDGPPIHSFLYKLSSLLLSAALAPFATSSFALTRCFRRSRRDAVIGPLGWQAALWSRMASLRRVSVRAMLTLETVDMLHLASGSGAPIQVFPFGCRPLRKSMSRCHLPPPAPMVAGPGQGFARPQPLCVPYAPHRSHHTTLPDIILTWAQAIED